MGVGPYAFDLCFVFNTHIELAWVLGPMHLICVLFSILRSCHNNNNIIITITDNNNSNQLVLQKH